MVFIKVACSAKKQTNKPYAAYKGNKKKCVISTDVMGKINVSNAIYRTTGLEVKR